MVKSCCLHFFGKTYKIRRTAEIPIFMSLIFKINRKGKINIYELYNIVANSIKIMIVQT